MGLSDLKVTPFGLPKIKKGSWIRIGGVRALNIYVDHHFNWFQKRMIKWCFGFTVEDDSLVIKVTRRDGNNFDMSFTDFANRMLNGLTTDYTAYEVVQKYKKFVMTQFFK